MKVEKTCLLNEHHITRNNSIHFQAKSHFALCTYRKHAPHLQVSA